MHDFLSVQIVKAKMDDSSGEFADSDDLEFEMDFTPSVLRSGKRHLKTNTEDASFKTSRSNSSTPGNIANDSVFL